MEKQNKLNPPFLTIRDMLILFLIWFFLEGFYEMTHQLVFEGSVFLTRTINYLFFIVSRLLFIPTSLYFILYKYSLPVEKFGLTLKNFWLMIKIGFTTSIPIVPLTIFMVHLPLIYVNPDLNPLIEAVTPENIAISLFFYLLMVFITIIPAFAEELLFRGITFSFLEERWSVYPAIFINSLLYSIFSMNFNLYYIAFKITFGFFSTYLFYKSRSLIPSTILQSFLHAAFILYVFGWGWW